MLWTAPLPTLAPHSPHTHPTLAPHSQSKVVPVVTPALSLQPSLSFPFFLFCEICWLCVFPGTPPKAAAPLLHPIASPTAPAEEQNISCSSHHDFPPPPRTRKSLTALQPPSPSSDLRHLTTTINLHLISLGHTASHPTEQGKSTGRVFGIDFPINSI